MRRRLLNAVRSSLIPCLQNPDYWPIVLGEPPFRLPPSVAVQYHRGKPLTKAGSRIEYLSPGVTRYWPDLKVHTNRFPYMGFVLKGEIPWRVGITSHFAPKLDPKFADSDYVVMHIPKGMFFLAPPGIPYASGEANDSMRQETEYQVFWMRFQPTGVQCHLSRKSPGEAYSEPNVFLPEPYSLNNMQALIEEMRKHRKGSGRIIHTLLQLITYRLDQNLENQSIQWEESFPDGQFPAHSTSHSVELACLYIESHYNQKLTLGTIAANAFVSEGHLCRLFKSIKKMSINEYITDFRLEYACQLLRDTQMHIKEIGHNVGYHNPAYFCQVFSRHFGQSPGEYRRKSRINKG